LVGDSGLLRIGDQQLWLAVIDPQAQPVESEQREQRHTDRAHHHRAEQAQIERQRWLQHEGDTVARLDAVLLQPVRKARGTGGDVVEAQNFVAAVGMRDAHRGATRSICVARDALVRNVQVSAVAAEQLPQRCRVGELLGICVARVFGEFRH
jgi:hypothetical protein